MRPAAFRFTYNARFRNLELLIATLDKHAKYDAHLRRQRTLGGGCPPHWQATFLSAPFHCEERLGFVEFSKFLYI